MDLNLDTRGLVVLVMLIVEHISVVFDVRGMGVNDDDIKTLRIRVTTTKRQLTILILIFIGDINISELKTAVDNYIFIYHTNHHSMNLDIISYF